MVSERAKKPEILRGPMEIRMRLRPLPALTVIWLNKAPACQAGALPRPEYSIENEESASVCRS